MNGYGYKNYTLEKLKKEFYDLFGGTINDGITSRMVCEWIKHYEHRVSFYGFLPDGKLIAKQNAYNENHQETAKVVMVVNNNHSYFIEDEIIIENVIRGHAENIAQALSGHVRNYRGNYSLFEKSILVYEKDLDLNKKYPGIVFVVIPTLPKLISKIKTWCNVDSMCIDQQTKTIINPINDTVYCQVTDFVERERICEKLFKEYGLGNFRWINQTYTNIGTSIFNCSQ